MSAAPASQGEAVTIVPQQNAPREPAKPPEAAQPRATVAEKQATETLVEIEPLGDVEVETLTSIEPTEVERQPTEATAAASTQAATTSPTAPRSQRPSPTTATTASLAQPQVRTSGANVDQPPRKLPTNRAPEYPLAARTAGIEGRVLLLAVIDESGHVAALSIRSSSGEEMLDEAAMRAVRSWRFFPARSGGAVVSAEVLVPVRFSIRGR